MTKAARRTVLHLTILLLVHGHRLHTLFALRHQHTRQHHDHASKQAGEMEREEGGAMERGEGGRDGEGSGQTRWRGQGSDLLLVLPLTQKGAATTQDVIR